MCGIIGYVGSKSVKEEILAGLKMLEYRGYDSAGICCFEKGKFSLIKKKGKVATLVEACQGQLKDVHCGIGHTRWATHGDPSDKNAHPFLSENNSVAIVHNGIIENFEVLKGSLQKQGVRFRSDTDSEVIAQLLQKSKCESELKKVQELSTLLKGSYAIAILFKGLENQIFAIRKNSPLIVGMSKDGFYLSSDVNALVDKTDEYHIMEENEIIWIDNNDCYAFDEHLQAKEIVYNKMNLTKQDISRGAFEHYMLKEIMQVPNAIKNTIQECDAVINPYMKLPREMIKELRHITIIGCGTAFNAGLTASHYAREREILVDCVYASEYRYRKFLPIENDVCIFISQSGETADTIEALKIAKEHSIPTIVVTNVASSTLNKLADFIIPTKAGPEIAVASTKAYNAQITALYGLMDYIYCIKHKLNCRSCILKDKLDDVVKKLEHYSFKKVNELADIIKESERVFYIGRGVDYATSQEASLKLKEISNIHSESLYAGELKHGTLALIDEHTTVIAIATQKSLFDKTLNSIYEIKARGARVILVTQFEVDIEAVDMLIDLPCTDQAIMAEIAIYPMQMLAYKTAVLKGLDPDKPRNLAKSVTVE